MSWWQDGTVPANLRGGLQSDLAARRSLALTVLFSVLSSGFVFLYFLQIGGVVGVSRCDALILVLNDLAIGYLAVSLMSSVHRFFLAVRTGEIEAHISRPVGLSSLLLTRWCRPLDALVAALPAAAALVSQAPDLRAAAVVAWAVSLLVGTAAAVALFVMLSLPTLWTSREVPADFVFEEVARLRLLPLSVHSPGSLALVGVLLPSILGAAVATSYLTGVPRDEAPLLLVGTVLAVGLAAVSFRRAWSQGTFLGG